MDDIHDVVKSFRAQFPSVDPKPRSNKYGSSEPSDSQVQQLCKDFLQSRKGEEFDAITAARKMDQLWGVRVDWHEMSYALDYLHRFQQAEIIEPGGFVKYLIL